MSKMYGDPDLAIKPGETWVDFWKRINSMDKDDIGLYCHSCCYLYPELCPTIETLHPYDRAAESCPDFIPKDYYKPKSKAKCWLKRLEVNPDWSPLPDCDFRHPIEYYRFVPSSAYYKIMTKMKALDYVNYKKYLEES